MSRLDEGGRGEQSDLFSLWNSKILTAFFSPASKGDSVWLQIDPAELDSIGPELGGDEGFLKAVRQGPSWPTVDRSGRLQRASTADLAARADGLVNQRKFIGTRPKDYIDPGNFSSDYAGKNAPTYLPILAALVRSVVQAEGGYYAALREALQLGPSWGSGQMEELEYAWLDLQDWTNQMGGEFGYFEFRILGGLTHVGVPRAQNVMDRRDSEKISRVFAQVGARHGQNFSSSLAQDIRARAADSRFLSAGFRAALSRKEFVEPITRRLRALFDEWDGTLPILTGSDRGRGQVEGALADRGNVGLCLTLQPGDEFPWNIHWRVPPLHDSGAVIIIRGAARWTATIRGTEYVSTTCDLDAESQSAAMGALLAACESSVEFDASLRHDSGECAKLGALFLDKSILRVLVWGYDEFADRFELQEHTLPRNGPAYLLTNAANTPRLRSWLERESLSHSLINAAGLPNGWVLVCLDECSVLTDDQRDSLPDGESERDQYRPIRLTGGRSVNRGGIRQYMAYDLPIVELDAPRDAVLSATGLVLNEEKLAVDNIHKTSIRRFRIAQQDLGIRSFRIVAILGSRELGATMLRVASESGEHVEIGNAFSLDPFGSPLRNDSGLRGTLGDLPSGGEAPGAALFEIAPVDLGPLLGLKGVESMLRSGAAQFLDTLARVGSMAYGVARDQLTRLLTRENNRVPAAIMLLDLRGRGHIEIETNGKGHMIRIHAIAPTIYALEATRAGKRVFGVLGTLRLQNWKSLQELEGRNCVHASTLDSGYVAAWRVVAENIGEIQHFAKVKNFALQFNAAIQIATWAATGDNVRERIERVAGESLGKEAGAVEKLNPNTGRFFHAQGVVFNRPGPGCQLFRLEDRDITGMRVYSLGLGSDSRAPRFGFTRDSRWGVWIALGAFASYLKEFIGACDASPWPIHYLRSDGTLLLPARMSLPVVLERAVNLCSGSGPETINVDRVQAAGAQAITLERAGSGAKVADVSLVYSDMAVGTWLAYRYVPKQVAMQIAEKLGAQVVEH
jgi:hypothetical protein